MTCAIELSDFAMAEHRTRCPTPFEYWRIMKASIFALVIERGEAGTFYAYVIHKTISSIACAGLAEQKISGFDLVPNSLKILDSVRSLDRTKLKNTQPQQSEFDLKGIESRVG